MMERFAALFPEGVDPAQWRLPSGHTISEASVQELLTTGAILTFLGNYLHDCVVPEVKCIREGVYEVKLANGRVLGEVRRYLGNLPAEIRAKARDSGGWFAVDVNGGHHYAVGKDSHFKTRDDAIDKLVTEFA